MADPNTFKLQPENPRILAERYLQNDIIPMLRDYTEEDSDNLLRGMADGAVYADPQIYSTVDANLGGLPVHELVARQTDPSESGDAYNLGLYLGAYARTKGKMQ